MKKKKHQERFPVVIDILKIAITFECQAGSNKSSKQNIRLEITQSSIHLIIK